MLRYNPRTTKELHTRIDHLIERLWGHGSCMEEWTAAVLGGSVKPDFRRHDCRFNQLLARQRHRDAYR
jgi:hypothetical protein